MITALKITIGVLGAFTALGLACAVRISLRREPQADPFAAPFGDVPGFSAEQLRQIGRVPANDDPLGRSFASRTLRSDGALRSDAGGGGFSVPSGRAAARKFSWWRRWHG